MISKSNDPIADRMTDAERTRWEYLKAEGSRLLKEAHDMYMLKAYPKRGPD